jgi:D-serine deaminase-like pyridoxal phosphate-dependent protein
VRVSLDIDAGLWLRGGRVRIGVRRSPVHTPAQAAALAREVVRRPDLVLAGVMAYEAQVAGVGDVVPGRRARQAAIRAMQAVSRHEVARRRARVVAAVQEVAGALEFVNAGGTGSVETSAAEAAVTEVAAGSGLYGPALFDAYTRFSPRRPRSSPCPSCAAPGRAS